MISLIAGSVILCAGIGRNGWKWIAGAAIPIITTLAFFGDKLLLDYQKKRILTYLYPEHDPLGAGYHILQSQIAIGSGGFWGKGYLQGPQNQLMFLPVKHTDFIFSVLAEEWGFIGCLVVFMLFSALILRGLSVSARAPTRFGALAAFGCTAILFWHVVMNTGMVMGLLPVVGVPLSFLSYGGSSLMLSYTCVAILCSAPTRRS
jgi:rod shape determining protein RodA